MSSARLCSLVEAQSLKTIGKPVRGGGAGAAGRLGPQGWQRVTLTPHFRGGDSAGTRSWGLWGKAVSLCWVSHPIWTTEGRAELEMELFAQSQGTRYFFSVKSSWPFRAPKFETPKRLETNGSRDFLRNIYFIWNWTLWAQLFAQLSFVIQNFICPLNARCPDPL